MIYQNKKRTEATMSDHKTNKWAKQILDSRDSEGMWGNFHTLSQPAGNKAITTEQALRRLRILGFTKDDKPIRQALDRMCLCVSGRKSIDSYYEKTMTGLYLNSLCFLRG